MWGSVGQAGLANAAKSIDGVGSSWRTARSAPGGPPHQLVIANGVKQSRGSQRPSQRGRRRPLLDCRVATLLAVTGLDGAQRGSTVCGEALARRVLRNLDLGGGNFHPGDGSFHRRHGNVYRWDRSFHIFHRSLYRRDEPLHLFHRFFYRRDGSLHLFHRSFYRRDGLFHLFHGSFYRWDGSFHLFHGTIHRRHGVLYLRHRLIRPPHWPYAPVFPRRPRG